MTKSTWLILVVGFLAQVLFASTPILGVTLQPLAVVILALYNRLTVAQMVLLSSSAGVLAELLSSGSKGEVFATYLAFGLLLAGIKQASAGYPEPLGKLIVFLLGFTVLSALAGLSFISNLTPTMVAILIFEVLSSFVLLALPLWLIKWQLEGSLYE